MALDRQLVEFMPHTVTIAAFTSKNNYGENAQGATRTAKAYVEAGLNLEFTKDTNLEAQPIKVYVNDTSIGIRDKITLPDGSTPEIISIEKYTVVAGLEHTVVTVR
jgi:hypothetical protein